MKLPISLFVLMALGQATTAQSTAQSTVAKSTSTETSDTKPKDDDQTNKRELDEGNFGERNKELLSKYEVTGSPPKIVIERELNELVTEQPPIVPHQQIFGVRLPPNTKISDVLSEHGPSFEAAVAKHLYSPISVYQTKDSSPTALKVPMPPAASQSVFPKLQKVPPKVELPNPHTPDFSRNRLSLLVDSFPKRVDSGLSRQQANLPQEIFRPQQMPKKPMASLFPIYDQLGPYRYQGEVVPSQYLHERGLYQIVPVRTGFDYDHQEGNRDNNYPNQGNHEPFKSEPTEIPRLQIDIPVSNQEYHAHPNGAISFARFSNKLPFNAQYNTAQQPQTKGFHQSQSVQLDPQIQSDVMLQAQEQKLTPVKPMVYRLIQELEKYEPVYQQPPQLMQPIQSQPRTLNALQQHLLFQVPQPFSNPQVIQLQQLSAFTPLPESLLAPEVLQQKNQLPISERSPRTFSFKDQSTQPSIHINIPIESVSTEHPLPSLKPDYSNYIKLLKSHSHTTPVFLPTPPQLIPTSTPTGQPVPDQLISSTTIQPTVKNHGEPKEQLITKETQPQPRPYLPLMPQIIHHSQPTVLSPLIQTSTFLPFFTQKPQSRHFQYTSAQPEYQLPTRPQSIQTSPRHDVVIQRQEIKELILEPDYKIRYQQREIGPQQEREAYQIRSQEQQQLFEQLQPLQFHQELQELNSEQYQLEIRQSPNQKHYHPLQPQVELSQRQQQGPQQTQQQQQGPEHAQQQQQEPEPAQQQQQGPEQSQQQQQGLDQAQPQQQGLDQAQQQQQGLDQAQQQQLGPEHAHQQQQEAEKTQQRQQEPEPAQQQQQGPEPAQQQPQGPEQAQPQQQESEQAQYLRHHVESDNNYQTSTLKSLQEPEEYNGADKNQQQLEPQPQQQQQSTEKPTAQIINLLQPISNEEQPYLDSVVTPIQPVQPQTYGQQQYVAAYTEYSPLVGSPSYSDVQYFGKFAESLLGNRHH